MDPSRARRTTCAALFAAFWAAGGSACVKRPLPIAVAARDGAVAGGASVTDGGIGGALVVGGSGGAVGAGGARDGGPPGTGGSATVWQVFPSASPPAADLLFVIDNSPGTGPLQDRLIENFRVEIDRLRTLPSGLPDLHIGVISTDTGPGAFDLPEHHCAHRGDQGKLQSRPRGSCTTPPLPPGQTFLVLEDGERRTNFAGDVGDAFACIARLGEDGCGFPAPLKSLRWALDPRNVPPGNEGFLRENAALTIVLLTRGDDCSVPDDSTLFDPTQELMSDPLGPFSSFRCNERGHLCDVGGTLGPPPRGPAANLTGCVSNETPTGWLTRVGDEAAFLKGLKRDPEMLVVEAITGPVMPYGIQMLTRTTSRGVTEPQPQVLPSCMAAGSDAQPAVRIQQWGFEFGARGLQLSACAPTFAPVLDVGISEWATTVADSVCPSGPFPPVEAPEQPPCRVVDRQTTPDGRTTETPRPNCNVPPYDVPCWTLDDRALGCPDGKRLWLSPGLPPSRSDLSVAFTCDPCPPGSAEIGCP